MPLTELTGNLGLKRAAHLLRRTCFGASISEITDFASLAPTQAVAQLFNTSIPDAPLPIDPLTGNDWINQTPASENDELLRYFLRWNIGQMVGNDVDISLRLPYIFRERIVLFMHAHFTTKKSKVGSARALYYQQALFRLYAFDGEDITIPAETPEEEDIIVTRSFRELTKKVSLDNAMLIFLDGRFNLKGSPNENYARELLELYSVGRGLEGTNPEPEFDGDYFTFTEQDVQAGARVLSGFDIDDTFTSLDEETNIPRGVIRGNGTIAGSHDEEVKTFSSRLGDAVVTPNPDLLFGGEPTEESVIDEISQMVDLIYDREETARHICRELYRFFVYHQIDESLQADIIQDMADIFIANEFKIQPVLEALLTSEHFYEAGAGEADNNFGGLIKSPLDLVVGFVRNFEIPVPDYSTDLDMFHDLTGDLLGQMNAQGMDYYEPFEVAGYSAYHQFPIYNRSWISTNYLTNRYDFIRGAISADSANMEMGQVDILAFVQANFTLATIRIANDFIISAVQYFLPVSENLSFDTPGAGELTPERLNYFKAVMFSFAIDDDPEAAWTIRWDNGFDPEVRANQLQDFFNAILQTPEYQLM